MKMKTIFATKQKIKESPETLRRMMKKGSYSVTLTAIVVAAAIGVNLIVSELPSKYTQIDLSAQKLSSVGTQTEEVLKGLTEDVTLYYIVQDSNKDQNISRLLQRYQDLSSHIKVEEKDPVRFPQFTSQYTSDEVSENSIIAVCKDNSRVISYSDMYEYEFDYNYYSYTTTGFDAEGQITSAIAAVSSEDQPVVYRLTGHGEADLSDNVTTAMEKANLETQELNLITADSIPEDAQCLLIVSPTSDISEAEAEKILDYLKSGKNLLLITDYSTTEMPNLDSVLDYYGITRVEGVVMEGDSQHYVQVPYYLVPTINSTEVTTDMSGGSSYVLMAAAQGLTTSDNLREETSVTEVLTTTDSAYSKTDVQNMSTYEKEDEDVAGPFALGMIATEEVTLDTSEVASETASEDATEVVTEATSQDTTEETTTEAVEVASETEMVEETEEETETTTQETGETKLAVYTSSSLLDSSMDQMVSGGNLKLFTNTLSWMCGQEVSVSIPAKAMSTEYLTLTAASSNFWSIMVIVLIPGAVFVYGLMIWLKRRKQ